MFPMPVDDESCKLITFSCHKHCFRPTGLLCGIQIASEILKNETYNLIKYQEKKQSRRHNHIRRKHIKFRIL